MVQVIIASSFDRFTREISRGNIRVAITRESQIGTIIYHQLSSQSVHNAFPRRHSNIVSVLWDWLNVGYSYTNESVFTNFSRDISNHQNSELQNQSQCEIARGIYDVDYKYPSSFICRPDSNRIFSFVWARPTFGILGYSWENFLS